MKIRNSFVSNSSSSSFILSFKSEPKNINELKELLSLPKEMYEKWGNSINDSLKLLFEMISKLKYFYQIKTKKELLNKMVELGGTSALYEVLKTESRSDEKSEAISEAFFKKTGLSLQYGDVNLGNVHKIKGNKSKFLKLRKETLRKYDKECDREFKEFSARVKKAASEYLEKTWEEKFRRRFIICLELDDNNSGAEMTLESGSMFIQNDNFYFISANHH